MSAGKSIRGCPRLLGFALTVASCVMVPASPAAGQSPPPRGEVILTVASAPTPPGGSWRSGLAVIRPDGSDRFDLLPFDEQANYIDGTLSPDGTRIAFVREEWYFDDPAGSDRYDIWVTGIDASIRINLTAGSPTGWELRPEFSPDGTTIAFHTSSPTPGDETDIYVVGADGSNPTNLTEAQQNVAVSPTFSPDGTKIAYRGSDGEHDDIWVMGADGSNPTELTDTEDQSEAEPSFSPDGRIAYIAGTTGPMPGSDIWVMNSDGTGRTNLTQDGGLNRMPEFSPDGSRIAFNSASFEFPIVTGIDLVVINSDGSGRRIIASPEQPGGLGPVDWGVLNPPPPSGVCGGMALTASGTDVGDSLPGTSAPDVIAGLLGADTIVGGADGDRICGGDGDDTLVGEAEGIANVESSVPAHGRDVLRGGPGADLLLGGPGRDVLAGGPGPDVCNGGPGKDKKRSC